MGLAGRTALVVLLVVAQASVALAADWYVSDASGIALEVTTESRSRRLDYALSIQSAAPVGEAPEAVRLAVPVGGSIELRTLYEKGAELRRRWIAMDVDGAERYVETRRVDGSISYERYDASRRFTEEGRFTPDGAGTIIRYSYTGKRLDRAEAFTVAGKAAGTDQPVAVGAATAQESPLWVDTYRYLRSGALLSVERRQLAPAQTKTAEAAPAATAPAPATTASAPMTTGSTPAATGPAPTTNAPAPATTEFARFEAPLGVPRLLLTRSADGSTFRTKYDASGRVIEREGFDPSGKPVGAEKVATYGDDAGKATESVVRYTEDGGVAVETTLDERGRAVLEVRSDANGSTISEKRTVWKENKIASIETVAGAETRRTEYEYDGEGNRMMERNYRNGVLERSVRRTGGEETEELYSDGVPVLRAVWVDGRKVSERRLRKDGAPPR